MTDDPQSKIDDAVDAAAKQGGGLVKRLHEHTEIVERRLPRFLEGSGERFVAIATTTILATPALRTCTPKSLLRCVVQAGAYGLTVDGILGHAYLVPYKNRGVKEAQLQIGYRGFVEMIIRSGKFNRLAADVVHERDHFEYVEGVEPRLEHSRDMLAELHSDGRGLMFAAYAIAHPSDPGGIPTFRVLSQADVYRHRASSKAWRYADGGKNDSPWHTHEPEMWQKTAIRTLAKLLPMSDERYHEVQNAALADEARDAGRAVHVDAVLEGELEEEAGEA